MFPGFSVPAQGLWLQPAGSHSLEPGGRAGGAAVLSQQLAVWKPSAPCAQPHTTPYLHTTLVGRVDEERLALRAQVSVLLEEMLSQLQQLLLPPGIGLVRRW